MGKRISQKHALWILGLHGLVAAVLALGLATSLRDHLQRPLGDWLRNQTGFAPVLSPHIRLLAIDGATRGRVDADDLPLHEWQTLLSALGGAKAVLFDKDFAAPLGREEATMFRETLQTLPVTKIARIWISRRGQVPEIDPNHRDLRRSRWDKDAKTPGPSQSDLVPTGIHPSMEKGFSHVGHFRWIDSFQIRPFLPLGKHRVAAALPLFLAPDIRVSGQELYINQKRMIAFSPIPLNLVSPSSVTQQTESLTTFLDPLREGQPLPAVSSEDVFLIVEGPRSLGEEIPLQARHRALASLTQSVLSGQWISSWGTPVGFAFLGLALALPLMATVLPLLWGVGGTLTLATGGTLTFLLGSFETPWLCLVFGFFLGSAIVAGVRRYGDQKKAARIRGALEGFVGEKELEALTSHPSLLEAAPRQHIVTVLFVDVVGFSSEIERSTPENAFTQIRTLHQEITGTVNAHGGIVGKALGDGLLCYFGFHYHAPLETTSHADAALGCALELQRNNLARNLEASQHQLPIYPLRIGMNTGTVYIGNIGTGARLEYSVMGQTVSTAKLLESACDDYCVMLGATTKDALTPNPTVSFHPRKVQVKRYREMVDAFEIDPLEADGDKKNLAVKLHREFLGLERRETRWPVPPEAGFEIHSATGTARLVNFSTSGLAVEMENYVGKGTTFSATFQSISGELQDRLSKDNLTQVTLAVRWGRPAGEGRFLHGLEIENLNQKQKLLLVNHLRQALTGSIHSSSTAESLPLPKKVG